MNLEIKKKIFAIQKEIGAIKKTKNNPFHNSMYFDISDLLEACKPILESHNVLLIQKVLNNKLLTELTDLDSGEVETSEIEIQPNPDAQKIGVQITYFRRYSLKSMLAIEEEDDDANSGVKRDIKPKADETPITERLITQKEVDGWNGKIYKGDVIYIGGEKIKPPTEQIEKLKVSPKFKKD